MFVVVSVLTMLVDLALLVFLAHPDTTDYIHGAWLVHHDAADVSDAGSTRWSSRVSTRRSSLTAARPPIPVSSP